MLFKHKHLLEELRKRGHRGTGEILAITTLGAASSGRIAPDQDLTTTWYDTRMVLRVVPEDRAEPSFEATVLTRIHTMKSQGSHVPVWYDPADHSKVVVDYEADVQRIMTLTAELNESVADSERTRHRYDQRIGVAWTPMGDNLVPVEALVRGGSGRAQANDWPAAGIQTAVELAVASVRGAASVILPPLDGGWDAWFARHDVFVIQAYGKVHVGYAETDAPNIVIAIALALISQLTGRMVRPEVAVTGGIAPSGEFQPVPALRDKAYAAKKGWAQRLVAPAVNEHELGHVPGKLRQDLEIVFAASLQEAMRAALTKHAAKGFEQPR